ncbi:Small auxin-up RNA [Dillenia turbinata]|uniref:Small auxin-up RNA n=1 Tax=Dillenia turbinata TaxID=194707 RepID=A0AAN8W3K2_9MAGN
MTTRRRSDSECRMTQHVSSGFLAVYVGEDRCWFVISTPFLNLPIHISLLEKAEEEFGFQSSGGLVPAKPSFLRTSVGLEFLQMDEKCFGGLRLDEDLKTFSEVVFSSCRESSLDKANPSHVLNIPLVAKS